MGEDYHTGQLDEEINEQNEQDHRPLLHLILATASAARAQTSTVPERPIFANLDIGGQVSTSTFSGTDKAHIR